MVAIWIFEGKTIPYLTSKLSIGAVVPFHHTIFDKDGVSKLILGYAHCGMVAAARWIAAKASKKITEALKENPTYKLKVYLIIPNFWSNFQYF